MNMKKIVITRPNEQGKMFAERVDCCDDDFFFEPLLNIEKNNTPLPLSDQCDYDGFVVTSIHSVDALVYYFSENMFNPVYCVGRSVAAAIKNRGDYDVRIVAPTVTDLVGDIADLYGSTDAHLLYLRGRDISFDIKSRFNDCNITLDEVICYEALPVKELSNDFIRSIENKEISAITFFSKRTAKVFSECVRFHNIQIDLKGIKALCISGGVLEYLNPIFGQDVVVSDTPDADGMLRIVRSFF